MEEKQWVNDLISKASGGQRGFATLVKNILSSQFNQAQHRITTFETTSTYKLVKGKKQLTTKQRIELLEELEGILKAHQESLTKKYGQLTLRIQGSVQIPVRNASSLKIKSSGKVLKIYQNRNLFLAVVLKPISVPNFSLGPAQFGLNGKRFNVFGEFYRLILQSLESKQDTIGDAYIKALVELLQIVKSMRITNATGTNTIPLDRENAELFADEMNTKVKNAINKEFAEVIGPFIVSKYLNSLKQSQFFVEFPPGKAQSGDDFTIIRNKNNEQEIYLFSVKSGAGGVTNVVKPSLLMEAFHKLPQEKRIKIKNKFSAANITNITDKNIHQLREFDLIEQLEEKSIKEGREFIQSWVNAKNEKNGTKLSLQKLTEEMRFNALYIAVLGAQLSYFKMNFDPLRNTLGYEIIVGEEFKKILEGSAKKMYLRDKGKKDKIGLTPP
jgi:hypothetical protein